VVSRDFTVHGYNHEDLSIALKKLLLFLRKSRMTLILLLIIGLYIYNVQNALFANKLDESWYANVQSRLSSMEKGETLSVENLVFDPEVYALAGWLYIHGVPPSEFNFEHPPLAKFFIGISEVVFHSPTSINALFGLATLLVVHLLSMKLFGKTFFALIPVYMLSLEKLFLGVARASTLDIYSAFFISLSVFMFLYTVKNPKLFPALSLVIGLGVACKWEAAFIILAFITFLLLDRAWMKLGYFMASLPLALLTYTMAYTTYFLSGHSFLEFLALQISIYKFLSIGAGTRGALLIWQLLLTGVIGPETRTIFFIDEKTGEIIKTVIVKGLAITYSFNPLTWSISAWAVLACFLKTLRKNVEHRVLPLWFISFMAPMSFALVLEHHLITLMPSFVLSIAYILKDGYSKGKGRGKTILLAAIIVYLGALAVWQYIRIPDFIAI